MGESCSRMRVLVLDTGPLGLLVHSNKLRREPRLRWLFSLRSQGVTVEVPAAAYYELRRKLADLRNRADNPARKQRFAESIVRLDRLVERVSFEPMTPGILAVASELWAKTVHTNATTAKDKRDINFDLLICASANMKDAVVATENVADIAQHSRAVRWSQLTIHSWNP